MFREVNLRSVHAPGGPDHLRIRLRSRLYNSQDMISLVLDGLGGKYSQPRHILIGTKLKIGRDLLETSPWKPFEATPLPEG